jgi:hypothetical protein
MYALIQKSGHVILKEWWYSLALGVSLREDLHMTQMDQVSVVDVTGY